MSDVDDLLRPLVPQVVGALSRRTGNFADAEDAAQEALVAAASTWPTAGIPDDPAAWLVRVAHRRLVDRHRSNEARRRREEAVAGGDEPPVASGTDDTLVLMYLCCHPSLGPSAAIALTLRAVGGLRTEEIARAFMIPVPTVAQRISRAKATLRAARAPFALPPTDQRALRLGRVLRVVYLIYTEGHTATFGSDLARPDLADEAIRLVRQLHDAEPDEPEIAGLLALLLLTDARRAARTGGHGQLVALDEQDRRLWDRTKITEGLELLTGALGRHEVGEYQLQASIAGLHDQAVRSQDTDWVRIVACYRVLERRSPSPMVRLNAAAAIAMTEGPEAGLSHLSAVETQLMGHHRLHAVRAHLLEMDGQPVLARSEYQRAAALATNSSEQHFLLHRAALLNRQIGSSA